MRSFRAIRTMYDKLRMRYYLDAETPLRVPPPANDPALRWAWMKQSQLWAATHFDAEGDPHLVEVPYGQGSRLTCLIVLHELSHMRNPEAECRRSNRWWRAEGQRLEGLGAFGREGIF